MRDKIYAYVARINRHYEEMNKSIATIGSLENIDFESITGKAFLFDLFQIGELVERFPDSFLNKLNKKDVKGVIDTRNHVVHGYEKLKKDEIIKSVSFELPVLIKDINNNAKESYEKAVRNLINRKVEVFVDQMVDANNQLNSGYIDNIVSPNGHFLEAYIIDIDVPMPRCLGTVVGIFKNKNEDCYCALVISIPVNYTETQIKDLIKIKLHINEFELIMDKK